MITQQIAYIEPRSLQEAMKLLRDYGSSAKLLAGGVDITTLLKASAIKPEILVGLGSLPELNHIRYNEGARLSIGAMTRLTKVCDSKTVRERYPILREAARHVATPQIRNMGTIAGNLLQEVWCWYLRSGFDCWKAGGKGCPAATGENSTYFSIMGGKYCMAAYSSDLGAALLALGAKAKVCSASGERILGMSELLPGATIIDGKIRSNALRSDEILTEITIPSTEASILWGYQRFSARECWDFPLVTVAFVATLKKQTGAVEDCKIALGGVAPSPYRVTEAERIVKESGILPDSAERAGKSVAAECRALKMNDYKIRIACTLVQRAISGSASLSFE